MFDVFKPFRAKNKYWKPNGQSMKYFKTLKSLKKQNVKSVVKNLGHPVHLKVKSMVRH